MMLYRAYQESLISYECINSPTNSGERLPDLDPPARLEPRLESSKLETGAWPMLPLSLRNPISVTEVGENWPNSSRARFKCD